DMRDSTRNGPSFDELGRQRAAVLAHAPSVLQQGGVDRMRRHVQRELMLVSVEGEPAVPDAARERHHRVEAPIQRAAAKGDEELDPVDGERGDAAALGRIQYDGGGPGFEASHRREDRVTAVLIEGLPLWLAETNCWVVAPAGPGGECILIDAPPDPAAILGRLQHHGLRLVALVSTHGHVDHVGGISSVIHAQPEPSTVPVHIHELDRHMLLDPVGTSGGFGRFVAEAELDLRPPELICDLDDGQTVRGAGTTLTAVYTPGH